jgi:hypothetical protein
MIITPPCGSRATTVPECVEVLAASAAGVTADASSASPRRSKPANRIIEHFLE